MLGQQVVLLEEVKLVADVFWVLACHVKEQALQVHQLRVLRIILPGRDLNSIPRLAAEVFFDIIDDDCLGEVASRPLQVLNVVLGGSRLHVFDLESMLAVKTMRDGAILVERVQNFIGILYTTNSPQIRSLAHKTQTLSS